MPFKDRRYDNLTSYKLSILILPWQMDFLRNGLWLNKSKLGSMLHQMAFSVLPWTS